MSISKSKRVDNYTVVILGDKTLTDDLNDCLIVSCTNKNILSGISGISYDRLIYIFTKLHKNVLHENGVLIIKSSLTYIGNHPGGIKRKGFVGFNRNV